MNMQNIEQSKGRPMLQWAGKRPLDKIEWFPAQLKEVYGDKNARDFNSIFWGDNLQVLSHLLKDYRGKVDLIYIDPPFDSKAEYVKKIQLNGKKIQGIEQSIIEETQYADIWEKDEYLQYMYERLILMKELLADTGSIYVHLDWHKCAYIKLIMDEVFGEENFKNEVIWAYTGASEAKDRFPAKHDNILFYTKTKNNVFNYDSIRVPYKHNENGKIGAKWGNRIFERNELGTKCLDWFSDIPSFMTASNSPEKCNYPTQKPEKLLERIIKASSKKGNLVLDCFMGSGTTMVVAQKLGRRFIGCDINASAIQTTIKRLSEILINQEIKNSINTFKVFNVNDYTIFKNQVEAKEIIIQSYGIEKLKLDYFDGKLGLDFVKILDLNRIINKLDIKNVIEAINNNIADFTAKQGTKGKEQLYKEKVVIICSGYDNSLIQYIKENNNTGVEIEVKDIQKDKETLVFKKLPEAEITIKKTNKETTVEIKDFYSSLLMQKLQSDNAKRLMGENEVIVEDFRQIIESVSVDFDYDGEVFNADEFDFTTKKEVVKAIYKGPLKDNQSKVAVKIIDILGEEYFKVF